MGPRGFAVTFNAADFARRPRDRGGDPIVRITPDGAKTTFAAVPEEPRQLTVDVNGNVFVRTTRMQS